MQAGSPEENPNHGARKWPPGNGYSASSGLDVAGFKAPPSLVSRINAEQIRLLLDLGAASRYSLFAAILIVGLAFHPTAPLWTIAAVCAIQLVAQTGFDRVRAGFLADPDAASNALIWARRYAAMTLISGSTWGVGGLLWLPGASFTHQVFYVMVLACLGMATAVSRANYPPAVAAYVIAAGAPTLTLLLMSGDPLAIATVALAAIFLTTIAGWTRRINRSYEDAIRLRLENADLVERMARAHAATGQERQDAEEAERRAKAANEAKSQFLAILGHEVRAPLDGLASMALQLSDEPLSETQRNLAQTIGESSQMLRRLFDDMIDFSQMEARTLELKPGIFDPAELAKSVVRLMRHQAKARQLSLELDLVPGTPPAMIADPDRLRQILVNLISNAIKFTETGGVILRVAPVPIAPAQTALRFSVSDTGAGLTPAMQARLFESFSPGKTHTAGRDKPEGMGLGLAICDRLVKLMGGRIGVDSVPGQGSTFWFLLPGEPGADTLLGAFEPGPQPLPEIERLVDHAHLYEIERALGVDAMRDHLVAALENILGLLRRIEAARDQRDLAALTGHAEALKSAASDLGLLAVSRAAREISQAIHDGQEEGALHGVPRLQQKISATWRALAQTFPSLGHQAVYS